MAPKDKASEEDVVVDEDAPGAPISVPDSGEHSEGGKLKMIVSLLKKSIGIKDLASMRLSLPASLMEPVPNLEYWGYLDRPDLFAAINDSMDPFQRMLAVVRFAFSKDIKFIHGRIVKPYNSVLGEHFRSHWDVLPVSYTDNAEPVCAEYTAEGGSESTIVTRITADSSSTTTETASVKSGRSSKSTSRSIGSSLLSSSNNKSSSTAATSPQELPEQNVQAQMSNLSLAGRSEVDGEDEVDANGNGRLRIVYLTEQVSHHPPVSSYYAACPAKNVEMCGVDQISAKVSGTTLRVSPGGYNRGIYVSITGGFGEGESYHMNHPVASVNGILRGSFYVTVSDSTIVTCKGTKGGHNFRAILEYKEESWLGKAHFLVEGVIHTYAEGEKAHEEWTKVKHVPHSRVCAVLDGTWRGRIRWKPVGTGSFIHSTFSSPAASVAHLSVLTSANAGPGPGASAANLPSTGSTGGGLGGLEEYSTLIDLSTLRQVPKVVRPLGEQEAYESRRLWDRVTTHLERKEYGDATREKVNIEQKQRDDAAERKRKGVEFVPKYFEKDIDTGMPQLTEEGRKAVEEELRASTSSSKAEQKSESQGLLKPPS